MIEDDQRDLDEYLAREPLVNKATWARLRPLERGKLGAEHVEVIEKRIALKKQWRELLRQAVYSQREIERFRERYNTPPKVHRGVHDALRDGSPYTQSSVRDAMRPQTAVSRRLANYTMLIVQQIARENARTLLDLAAEQMDLAHRALHMDEMAADGRLRDWKKYPPATVADARGAALFSRYPEDWRRLGKLGSTLR